MQALARVSPWTLALALLVFDASPAVATLIGQSLTVELISSNDGNLHLSDSLTAAGGGDILPDDGSAIGSILLSTEFIDLGTAGGDRIVIGLEEGVSGGLTGYGDQARYVVSGLYGGLGFIISGISVTTANITGVSWAFDDHSVTVFIDDLVIGEIAGIDSGSVTIDLTTAVPEPATGALVLLGVTAFALGGRRRST
jgi:PEP-CTERM motif